MLARECSELQANPNALRLLLLSKCQLCSKPIKCSERYRDNPKYEYITIHSSNGIKVLYCYKMYGMNTDDGIRETTRSSMRRVSSLNSAGPTTSGDSQDLFSSLQGAESDRP